MIFIEKIKSNVRNEFEKKNKEIADKLKVNPNYLMLVYFIETGASVTGSISAQARNSKTMATGLIQFMPATANDLGTSIDELYNMNEVQQLDYVYKYLKPWAGRLNTVTDCYLAVLFPAAIGKPDDFVLETKNISAHKMAQFNPLYDINKDGKIQVYEITKKLLSFVPAGTIL